MKKYIIIVGVNPFNGNRGVGALAYSTLFLLDKISKECNQPLNIHLVGVSRRFEFAEIAIGDSIIKISHSPFWVDKGFKGFIKSTLTLLLSYRIISKTKYIMDMGEGDSFSDIYGEQRFIRNNTPKKIFRFLGKKQLLLPQTIGPFSNPKIAKEAKKSIEKSEVVLTRDKVSYDYVINNTFQRNVKELIDVAFFMPYKKKIIKNEKINVGLNISSLMWHGGYTKNNQFGLKVDYQQLMEQVIDFFLSQPEVQLYLVPHVVLPSSNVENDYEVSRMIQEKYDSYKISLSPFFLDPIDAKNFISGLDFFSGARMHSCIAAFSSGVPVFPISYSRKFNGLFEETLEYPYMGDLKKQTSEEFMAELGFAFRNRSMLSEKIKVAMENIVSTRYDVLMNELRKFLDIK